MNLTLEIDFINKYVVKEKRQRYVGFIKNPKRRSAFLEMLYHGQDLDKSKFRKVEAFYEQTILKKTASMPDELNCYIISVDIKLDGREMSVAEGLKQVGPYTEGTVLLFTSRGECETVYYRGEPPYNEWLSL